MSKTPFLDPLTSDVFVSNVSSSQDNGADPLSPPSSFNPLLQSHPPSKRQPQQLQQQRRSSPINAGAAAQPVRASTLLSRNDVEQPVRSNSTGATTSLTNSTITTTTNKRRPANTISTVSRSDRPKIVGGIVDPLSSSPPTDSLSDQPLAYYEPLATSVSRITTNRSAAYNGTSTVSSSVKSSSAAKNATLSQHPLPKNANTSVNHNRNTVASFPVILPSDHQRVHPASEPNSTLPSPAISTFRAQQNQHHHNGSVDHHDGIPASPPSPRVRRRDLQYDGQRVDASRIKAPPYLHITIPDTDRRAKDGMFVLNVQTNIPRYRRQSYQNVTRSYLEFVRLREHLVAEHPEVIVPVLPPERSLISLSDIEAIRTFLSRISKHPILSQDYELQMFIESEFGFLPQQQHYHHHNPLSRSSRSSLGRLLGFGVTKRFSASYGGGGSSSGGETDDEFEEEWTTASKAESNLQTVIKYLDREIKARRDFSSRELELAGMASAWANTEEDLNLSRTFKLLSKPLDGIAKASKAQVGGDTAVLAGFLEYKLQHVQTLSQTLEYRLSVVSEYETAVKSTENKRKIMERLRSSTSINPDKVTDSIDDLDDAILFEGNMKTRMDQVSETVLKELVEYRQQSTDDLFHALRLYTQRQINFEKAKLEELLLVGGDKFSDTMYTSNLLASFADTKVAGLRACEDEGEDDDDDDDDDSDA